MSEHIKKSHNKTLLLYHLVFPSKYRKDIFNNEVEKSLKDIVIGMLPLGGAVSKGHGVFRGKVIKNGEIL